MFVVCSGCPQPATYFRHPPARRFSAATGGPSGARERDPVGSTAVHAACRNRSPSAPLGPPVSLRSPEDDESAVKGVTLCYLFADL